MTKRQMSLVGFMQAGSTTVYAGSWRHPATEHTFLQASYYQKLGRTLEEGCFDMLFFDDRLAMPDRLGNDHAHTVEYGIRCVKMDPIVVLMVMGMATRRLGLGATYSTTYYEPFHVARLFQTVDLMTRGRAAWNVVTSVNDNEARNMGREGVIAHDTRYDRADEFLEVVLGHWDSWDDDAIVADKANNLYARPDKVRRIDFKGKFLSSRGPFTVPRSPQGHPVVIQAGQSGRGKRFASRWGELIFVNYRNFEEAKKNYAELKDGAAALGRNPDHMKITTLAYVMTGESQSEAEDKKAAYDKLSNDIDQLSLLSEALNFDFASKGMDEPFTEEEIEGIQGMQAMRDRVVASGKKNPTVRDFMSITGRGLLSNAWVGGPKQIADKMEEWFSHPVCDGFVIGPTHQPGSFEEFVKHIVPELQKRGIYRKEYSGATLRDHLGLAKPAIGAWRTKADAAKRP